MLEKELQSRTPMGVIGILQETGSLPMQYHPHKLSGKFEGLWECHIKSDWLLIWQQNDTELVLISDRYRYTHSIYFKTWDDPLSACE